jgi:hypothetical protein
MVFKSAMNKQQQHKVAKRFYLPQAQQDQYYEFGDSGSGMLHPNKRWKRYTNQQNACDGVCSRSAVAEFIQVYTRSSHVFAGEP